MFFISIKSFIPHSHTPVLFTARPTEIPRFTILHSRIAEKASCSLVLWSVLSFRRPPLAAAELLPGCIIISAEAAPPLSPLARWPPLLLLALYVVSYSSAGRAGRRRGARGKREGGKEEGGCSNRTVAERQSDGSSTQRTSKARVLLSP